MLVTAMLFSKALLWLEHGAHYSTLSERLLGRWALVVSWILYPFIGYASIVAYIAEGGRMLSSLISSALPTTSLETHQLADWVGPVLFTLIFGYALIKRSLLGRFNNILMAALVIGYLLLVQQGMGSMETDRLHHSDPSMLWHGLPICVAMFSFHTIVPTVCRQLHYQQSSIAKVLIIGSMIPLVIYAVWQLIVIGAIPVEGESGLKNARELGVSAGALLASSGLSSRLVLAIQVFSFAALSTCFLGFSIGMVDFLEDGLKGMVRRPNRLVLLLTVLLPSLGIALVYPGLLLRALDLSGAFGDAILNGVFPVLMVWRGRFALGLDQSRLDPEQAASALSSANGRNNELALKSLLLVTLLFFLLTIGSGLPF
jgi:tyrosine-specific transport protein